jgi:hypothetical protein
MKLSRKQQDPFVVGERVRSIILDWPPGRVTEVTYESDSYPRIGIWIRRFAERWLGFPASAKRMYVTVAYDDGMSMTWSADLLERVPLQQRDR